MNLKLKLYGEPCINVNNPKIDTYQAYQRAIQMAHDELCAQGIYLPMYDSKLTASENHDRICAYCQRESVLVIKYLKSPSGERPIAFDSIKQTSTEWRGYRDE